MEQPAQPLIHGQTSASHYNAHDKAIRFNLGDEALLYLIKQFYAQDVADNLFHQLYKKINWQEEHIYLFNKRIKVPRLMAWYGDPSANYRYSSVDHHPLPWIEPLLAIREHLEQHCQAHFNSVLANLYRNGGDSMGCHADDEKELGANPVIASLSLGDERIFKLHHKKSKRSYSIPLANGDLLVMAGACQKFWLHSIPKTKAFKSPRINLTYRKIIPA
jgi:alkylated DNA repair dioxygenase AlkB